MASIVTENKAASTAPKKKKIKQGLSETFEYIGALSLAFFCTDQVTSTGSLHWCLSLPKAGGDVRYRRTASSNQIREELEQKCSTHLSLIETFYQTCRRLLYVVEHVYDIM